jgi:valyl-tRNA synthetase
VLAKTEIVYKQKLCKKYNIRYFVDMKRDSVVVSTFHPDTIFADVALAVNPLDKRYKKII